MPRHPSFQLASLLFAGAVLAGAGARAAELGDAKVNSYLGQQLSADIELTSLHDANGTVLARVASLDVYRGAGLELPPVLSSVNLAVVRRDGRQFLHVTSTRPIEADHLHLYLELADGGQRGVRLATLWFTPDPAPPAPRLVASPVPAPPVVQEIAPKRTVRAPFRAMPANHQKLVRPLPEPAAVKEEAKPAQPVPEPARKPAEPVPAVTKPAKLASVAEKTPPPHLAHVPVTLAVASKPEAKPEAPEPALPVKSAAKVNEPKPAVSGKPVTKAEEPKPTVAARTAPKPDEPKPAPIALAAAKASQVHPAVIPQPKPVPACPKEPSKAEATCSALDGKNAELRAELVKLEERVKTLQAEAKARAAAEARAAAAPKPVEAPKPAMPAKPPLPVKKEAAERPAADEKFGQVMEEPPARPVFKPVKLKAVVPVAAPAPAAPEELPAGMPWGWIAGAGGGVFATVGGLQFWRHRRKQVKVHRVHAPLPDHDVDDDELIEPTLI